MGFVYPSLISTKLNPKPDPYTADLNLKTLLWYFGNPKR